jgi:glycosyltransferase involved in cell wall biosynthesis
MNASDRATVDVIIPSLRGGEPLRRALDSVAAAAAAVADRFDVQTHIAEPGSGAERGPAAARNCAVAQGQGEYLALLDDDDSWLPRRLVDAVDLLRSHNELALVCGDADLASGGCYLDAFERLPADFCAPGNREPARLDHRALSLDCVVCASTVTLRRRDWEAAGGMDESLRRAEDYELWLRLTRDGRVALLLADSLAVYGNEREGDAGARLSDDLVAMAEATLRALEQSSSVSARDDSTFRDRVGRLRAVAAHGMARSGRVAAARRAALRAVREAPGARVAWTSLARALISPDRS